MHFSVQDMAQQSLATDEILTQDNYSYKLNYWAVLNKYNIKIKYLKTDQQSRQELTDIDRWRNLGYR